MVDENQRSRTALLTDRPHAGAVFGVRLKHWLTREPVLAAGFSLLAAIVLTWPTLAGLTDTIPQDTADPLLQAWQVAWNGHALLSDPGNLWQTNAFFPAKDALAFSDSLLGYAPAGLIGNGPVAALVRYNLLFILAYALACAGGYALARQLGASWQGAAVTGFAFAFAPWRLAHGGHLNILSTGGIALALAMLARGHGFSLREGYRPDRVRPGWALAGWLVAAWQLTLGFGIGLPFAYVLAGVVLVSVIRWFTTGRPPLRKRLFSFDVAGGAAFTLTSLLMGLPYLRVLAANPDARRSLWDVDVHSPPWYGFFLAPNESAIWGDVSERGRAGLAAPAEMTLLVGLILITLAVFGLTVSAWSRKTRVWLTVGTAVSVTLALGTKVFGDGEYTYLLLYHYLPAWDAIRTPSRLVVWTTLLLGLLAAGGVTYLCERAPRRNRPLVSVALLLPALLVLTEGANRTAHPEVPTSPVAMRTLRSPALILPSDQIEDQQTMFFSTDGFPVLANGGSGFLPKITDDMRQRTKNFPDAASAAYLRQLGVRTVVVHNRPRNNPAFQRARSAPLGELNIVGKRVDDDVYIFSLE
ncbi:MULTISPECIES: hypothetical protein [unclassified Crossiella]|uniref:hypothetical protein n=1 Tax=unclassified Crossiella TaxID=2620835 RepID=UPI001FFFC414|nr:MULTISPECIES: hypothetical protein [unclassified Crossiella]MCK2240546.1 hypothetical protein [Crossiella sp. S99.2]MCK2253003.1 hypothetical protein [Crossiella sp. S99.1]